MAKLTYKNSKDGAPVELDHDAISHFKATPNLPEFEGKVVIVKKDWTAVVVDGTFQEITDAYNRVAGARQPRILRAEKQG